MMLCMQNSEKKILTINRLWSSITGVLKLLFEITYIYEVFYCEKEIQKYFLIKLTDGILYKKWLFALWIPQKT